MNDHHRDDDFSSQLIMRASPTMSTEQSMQYVDQMPLRSRSSSQTITQSTSRSKILSARSIGLIIPGCICIAIAIVGLISVLPITHTSFTPSMLMLSPGLYNKIFTRDQPSKESIHNYQCSNQAIPASPRIDDMPIIEHWSMCPLAHQYPYLHAQLDANLTLTQGNQSISPFARPSMSSSEWVFHQWTDTSYPRVFLLDPYGQKAYAIIVSEAGYDVKPDHWTSIITIQEVATTEGDYIPMKQPIFHPFPNANLFKKVAALLTCSDSITSMHQPVEIEYSYHFIRLHCPFALRPLTPHAVARSGHTSSASNNTQWAQTSAKFDQSSMVERPIDYPTQTIRFYHPLFAAAVPVGNFTGAWNMTHVVSSLNVLHDITVKLAKKPKQVSDWLVLQAAGELPIAGTLSIPMCFSCKPRVDVALCTPPLINQANLNDFHSHIQYHVALGVQRFTIYDRNSLFVDVLRPYIDSGLVDLVPFPLPWRNNIRSQDKRMYSDYFDQTLALESCRVRSAGVASWIVYKDNDEWIQFPTNSSFVRQDRTARCYSSEWRESPDSLIRATGAKRYVHMNVGLDQAQREQHRGDSHNIWSSNTSELVNSRTSLYSYIQPDSAEAFLKTHRRSEEGIWPSVSCPSPLLAWLTSLNDIRVMQSSTFVPDIGSPVSHRDVVNKLLPLSPPSTTSSTDAVPKEKRIVYLSDQQTQKARWQFFRLCDVIVAGPANHEVRDADENYGSAAPADHKLLFDRFPTDSGHVPVRSAGNAKWIGRPELLGLFIHNLIHAQTAHDDSSKMNWPKFNYGEPNDIRPCEEIHFKHFSNYPRQRQPSNLNATIPVGHFADTWRRIVSNAKPSQQ